MKVEAKPGRIAQIAIRVENLDRAIHFYRDLLELPYLFEAGPMAFFDCGNARLMIGEPEQEMPQTGSTTIYFQVKDIQESFDALSRKGIGFISAPHLVAQMPDHELWMAFFKDLDGNSLALMSEVPRA